MAEERRALAICAHDDDEVIGAGGTIRALANRAVRVTTMVLATGNEGYTRIEERDTIVERRRRERNSAQRILGTASCIACDHRDFENLDSEAVYHEIFRAVRSARPHIVFTHLPGDYMAHRTLGRVAPEAVRQAGGFCAMELGEPWKVEALYQFSILELIGEPSHLVDITDTFEAKREAMRAYESQHSVVAGILERIEGRAIAYGSLIGVKYAEAFVRSPHLPVSVGDPIRLFGG